MVNNYGAQHTPVLKRNIYGGEASARTTLRLPVEDGTALYLGQFVAINDATNGKEFGVTTLADDDFIFGFVSGFARHGSNTPIWDDPQRAGTVTDATGELPVKYTFASDNDEGNTNNKNERVLVTPVMVGDILEVSLWGAGATSVNRGTTTAAGTTGSSANFGVSMSIDTTYPFALTESTAAVAQANLDMMTVELDDRKPENLNRQYVMVIRGFSAHEAAA